MSVAAYGSASLGGDGQPIAIATGFELDVLNGKGFIANTNLISGLGASETPIFLLTNPTGSGVTLYGKAFRLGVVFTGSPQYAVWRLYKNPTITSNGTAITPQNLKIMGSPPASVVTPFLQPTISNNGTFMSVYAQHSGAPSIIELLIVIDAGNSILLTTSNSNPNISTYAGLVWSEK